MKKLRIFFFSNESEESEKVEKLLDEHEISYIPLRKDVKKPEVFTRYGSFIGLRDVSEGISMLKKISNGEIGGDEMSKERLEKYKTDEEIINSLKTEDIPDTRKLQKIRIESIDIEYPGEKFMKEHYREKWEKNREIIHLPLPKQKEIYSLVVPLSFPILDYAGWEVGKKFGMRKTCFSHWTSWDGESGSLHLTTEKNLEKIRKILEDFNIPTEKEASTNKVCEFEEIPFGFSAKHSWVVDHFDYSESQCRHIFVAYEKPVYMLPYYFIERKVIENEKREKPLKSLFEIEKSHFETKEFNVREASFCEEHLSDAKSWIEEHLSKYERRTLKERDYRGKIKEANIELKKMGDPVLIYDPEWVKS